MACCVSPKKRVITCLILDQVCGSNFTPTLLKYVDKENLPEYLGGTSTATLVDDAGALLPSRNILKVAKLLHKCTELQMATLHRLTFCIEYIYRLEESCGLAGPWQDPKIVAEIEEDLRNQKQRRGMQDVKAGDPVADVSASATASTPQLFPGRHRSLTCRS